MTSEGVLVPVDEQIVDFYGDEITTALVQLDEHFQVYVPLRPICEYLGLSWSGQCERINRDAVLSEEMRFVRVSRMRRGGSSDMLCLPLEFLHGWLFGISASSVKPELREKVIRYQRECYTMHWQAFQSETPGTTDTTRSASIVALEHIRKMGLATVHMAEQQSEMEQRVNARLDRAAKVVGDIQRRLGGVERKLPPSMLLTDRQVEEISTSVKSLAEIMPSRSSEKYHYEVIFAELYREFGVSSYKTIQGEQYFKVLEFVEEWRMAVQPRESSQTRKER